MQDPLCQTYVLSLRRDQRATIPADWKERIRALPGVVAGASASPMRMRIEVTPESLAQLRQELGHLLLIEPDALRGPLGA